MSEASIRWSYAFFVIGRFSEAFLGIIVLGGLIYRADLTGITVMGPKKFIEPSFCILSFLIFIFVLIFLYFFTVSKFERLKPPSLELRQIQSSLNLPSRTILLTMRTPGGPPPPPQHFQY